MTNSVVFVVVASSSSLVVCKLIATSKLHAFVYFKQKYIHPSLKFILKKKLYKLYINTIY